MKPKQKILVHVTQRDINKWLKTRHKNYYNPCAHCALSFALHRKFQKKYGSTMSIAVGMHVAVLQFPCEGKKATAFLNIPSKLIRTSVYEPFSNGGKPVSGYLTVDNISYEDSKISVGFNH